MDRFLTHLAERRSKLTKQLQKLQQDIADIDKAERLYRDSGAAAISAPVPPPPPPPGPPPLPGLATLVARPPLPPPLPPPGRTIKQRVLAILGGYPSGLTSGQILNLLHGDGGSNISRESLSPQLTRLKSDAEIELDPQTSLWRLPQKHESQGA
jgi:hypothetical protein